MKSLFQRIRNWSNANQGFLSLLALIVAIAALVPIQRPDISAANSILDTLGALLTYAVQIPVYILLVIVIASTLLVFYLRRTNPKSAPYAGKILRGRWENRWGPNLQSGVEIAEITKDGKYVVAGRHSFNIHDFHYDEAKRQVRFVKVGLGQDYRRLYNVLSVEPDNKLIGMEEKYPIAYTKLS